MDWINALAEPQTTRLILEILLDTVLKGALILALAGIVTTLLRRASAATRHLVWGLALGSLFVLPLLSLVLPSWQVLTLPSLPVQFEHVATEVPEILKVPYFADAPQSDAEALAPTGAEPAQTHPPQIEEGSFPESEVATGNGVWEAFISLYAAMRQAHWTQWLIGLWMLGIGVCILRFVMGGIGVRLLRRGARPIHDLEWLDLADEVGDRLYLRRPVRLIQSARTAMPMTWGFWRPVVLLPSSANSWSETRRRCVLTHEFAHIKRGDCLSQAFAQLICALHWFHPLAWVAARQMRVEREVACDDFVLNGGTRPSDYATHLIEIARSTRVTFVSPLSAVSMARPSQLEGRVLSILDPKRRRRALGRATMVVASVLTVALVLPLAALQPSDGMPVDVADPEETWDAEPQVEAIPVPLDPAYESGARSLAPRRNGVYTWTGKVQPGDQVEIAAVSGNIHVEPTDAQFAEVIAKSTDPKGASQVQVRQHENVLLVCLPGAPDVACSSEFEAGDANGAVVDLLVRLPQGVHLKARTVQGDISAKGLSGIVTAESVMGDIDVETSAYAEAHTVQGDVQAKMGTTNWLGTLTLKTEQGAVSVLLPEQSSVEVSAKVRNGVVQAPATFEEEAWGEGGAKWGVLGEGGRSLLVYSNEGSVNVINEQAFAFVPPPNMSSDWVAALQHAEEDQRLKLLSLLKREDGDDARWIRTHLLLHDPSPEVRATAAWLIGEEQSAQAVSALVQSLTDSHEEVRMRAAWALGEVGDSRALSGLFSQLQHEPNADVRAKMVWALGEIGNVASVEILSHSLQDQNDEVRRMATWSLRELNDATSVPSLISALEDRDERVRALAVDALANWSDPRATDALSHIARSDPSTELQRKAKEVLKQYPDQDMTGFEFEIAELNESNQNDQFVERRPERAVRSTRSISSEREEISDGAAVHIEFGGMEVDLNPQMLRRFADWAQNADFDIDLDTEEVQYLVGRVASLSGQEISLNASMEYKNRLHALELVDVYDEGLAFAQTVGIQTSFIRKAQALRCDITLDEVIRLRLSGVEESFLRSLATANFIELNVEQIIALRAQEVSEGYIRALASLGYDDIHPDEVIALHEHGIDGAFIREMGSAGYRALCPDELIQLHAHEITKSFVKKHWVRANVPPSVDLIIEKKIEEDSASLYSISPSR